MPFPKIKAASATDSVNDSLDTYITQPTGKEPLLSFSKPNDAPVQLFQFLHSLDQGFPLLSPLKVQMQKCDKCSREFCSTINYRRHMRLHRRNLNPNKDSTIKNRSLLQAYWDKLSVEEAMEIMSFKDVSLEGVPGSSIIKALTSFIRKPGFTALPQQYVKAGYALLDIVQARPSMFPISSQELFNVLDEASEKTFLCAGAAESLHKYVFDGEAEKIGLEMRNVVACTSFLAEQKLFKAFLADKDAEALRYQKLLMEEEEAAQNRQAALLEKKRQKKLRQKEQREKELASMETDDSPEDSSPSPPTSSQVDVDDSFPEISETTLNPASSPEPIQFDNDGIDMYERHDNGHSDLGTYHHYHEHRIPHRSGRRYMTTFRRQAPAIRRMPNGFHPNHNCQGAKSGPIQKHVGYRDFRTAAATNGGKVWTPKPKSKTDEESHKSKSQIEVNLPGDDKKHELFIGSITVTVGYGKTEQLQERLDKTKAIIVCRPVSQCECGSQLPVRNCSNASEVGVVPCDNDDEVQQMCRVENNPDGLKSTSNGVQVGLATRWKQSFGSYPLELFLRSNQEGEPPGCGGGNPKVKSKMRPKPEKGSKLKYIPKQSIASLN